MLMSGDLANGDSYLLITKLITNYSSAVTCCDSFDSSIYESLLLNLYRFTYVRTNVILLTALLQFSK